MESDYRTRIAELIKILPQVSSEKFARGKNSIELHTLETDFNDNALNHQSSGKHDIYLLNTLFSIILINYVKNDTYSFTYIDFNSALTYYDNFSHFSRAHSHNYFELLFVLDGQLDVFIEGIHYRYNRGDACLINRNIRHSEDYCCNFTAIYFCITKKYLLSWSQEEIVIAEKGNVSLFFRKNLSKSENSKSDYIDFSPIIPPEADSSTDMEKLIFLIMKEMIERAPGYKTIIRGLLMRFFFQFENPSVYGLSYVQLDSINESNLFEDTLRYINEKKGKITRQELAEALHYNGNYINQVFLKHTKQTLTEYSRNIILREAANLLLNSNISVAGIIKQLGFENRTSFYNQFKKRYGVTPLEYRKGNYSNND